MSSAYCCCGCRCSKDRERYIRECPQRHQQSACIEPALLIRSSTWPVNTISTSTAGSPCGTAPRPTSARLNFVRAAKHPGDDQTCQRCCASRGPERAQDLAVAPKCRHASLIRTNCTRSHVGPGALALLPCLSGLDTSPGPRSPCTYTA
jgi:hypothetical protein